MKFSFASLLAASMLTFALVANAAPSPQASGGTSEYKVVQIPEVESNNGVDFNDARQLPESSNNCKVISVSVFSGERLDAISISFINTATGEQKIKNSGNGGRPQTLTLHDGEFFKTLRVSSNQDKDSIFINGERTSIKLETNLNRKLEAGTVSGAGEFSREAEAGFQIVGFHGNEENDLFELAQIFGRI